MGKKDSFRAEGPSASPPSKTGILKSSEAPPVHSNPDRISALLGAMSEETKSTLMKNLQSQLTAPKKAETEQIQPTAQQIRKDRYSSNTQSMSFNDSESEKTDLVGSLNQMKVFPINDSLEEGKSTSDSMKSLLQRKVAANQRNERLNKYSSRRMGAKPAALSSSQSHYALSTSTLRREKSTTSMKKCVSFEENPVKSVKAIEAYETELKNSVWYSENEYNGMKNSIKTALRQKKSGEFEESENSTMLGLETFLNRRENKEKRKEAIAAVIFEQARQRIKRIPSDPMLLAEAYRSKLGGATSKSCSNFRTSHLDQPGTKVFRSSSFSVNVSQTGSAMQNAVWENHATDENDVERTAATHSSSQLHMKLMQGVA